MRFELVILKDFPSTKNDTPKLIFRLAKKKKKKKKKERALRGDKKLKFSPKQNTSNLLSRLVRLSILCSLNPSPEAMVRTASVGSHTGLRLSVSSLNSQV